MALTEQTVYVRVMEHGIEPRLYMVQADTGRTIRCIIEDWDIPSGASAKVYVRKISGKVVYNTCTVDRSSNSVIIDVTSQMIAEAGADNLAMVEITSGDECVTTFAFFLIVKYKFGDGTESQNESTWVDELMQKYIDAAEALLKDTQDAASEAADSAQTAENAASDAAKSAQEAGSYLEAVEDAAARAEKAAASAGAYESSVMENAEKAEKAAEAVLAESEKIDERLDRAEGLIDSTLEAAEKTAENAAAAQEAADRAEQAAKSVTGFENQISDLEERVEYLESLHGIETERIPFAIYSADDTSLTFYTDKNVPDAGSSYNGKTATEVYTGFDEESYTAAGNVPWSQNAGEIVSVVFNKSFAYARPISTAYWFYRFSSCTQMDLTCLNTEDVTDMRFMFNSCGALTQLDVSGFDTSKVTAMNYMFSGCESLVILDVSGFNTAKVANIIYIFQGCKSLEVLNVSNFDTAKATSLKGMFESCNCLKTIDVSGFDTAGVTDVSYLFDSCESLSEVDVSGFDTSKVTSMTYMFNECSALTTIYSDDSNFVTDKVTSGGRMFSGCTSLVGGNGTKFNTTKLTYTMAHVDTADNPGYFTGKE